MAVAISEQLRHMGGRNALTVSVIMFVVFGLLTAVLMVVTPVGLGDAAELAALLLATALLASGLIIRLRSGARGGPVLLDTGYTPHRKLSLFNSLTMLSLALMSFSQASPGTSLFFRPLPILFLIFAAFALISAFTRLQIREGGIWTNWGLLPWRKIASYRWLDKGNLLVQTKGRSLFRSGGLVVPPEHRTAFGAYLEQYAG